MPVRGDFADTARAGATGSAVTVVVVTVGSVVVVGRGDPSVFGVACVPGRAFATDRLGGRTGTTDDVFVLNSPNHNNGPTTSRHSRGPRAKRRMRRKVRPWRRTSHSKAVMDGS
jgi:hypothetical protein